MQGQVFVFDSFTYLYLSIPDQNGQLFVEMVKCRILGVTHIPVSDKTHFN